MSLVRVKLTPRSICPCGWKPVPEELELINLLTHFADFDRRMLKETPKCRGCGKVQLVEAVWMESSSANGKMAGWMPLAAIDIEGEKTN